MALLPKDPAKQKVVLIGLLALIVAFGYYQFLYSPRMVEIEEKETNLLDLTAKNDGQKVILARYGTDLPRRIAILQEHIQQLEELIPKRDDLPRLINLITEGAQNHNVQMVALNPAPETAGEFYSQHSYSLQVLGDYHSIAEYLAAVGSLPRIVRPTELNLTVEAGTPEGPPVLRAQFRLETFVMPDRNALPDTTAGAVPNANE